MISTGYDLRCETVHFAWRKIRFVFAGFGLVDAGNEMAAISSLDVAQNAGDLEVAVRKKLRKRAAKFMKSWVRVNLCAGSAGAVSGADARPNKGRRGLRPKRPLSPS
jgi:hypothetical protein